MPRRIAIMLELEWPYPHITDMFAGVRRYAQAHNWETIIDEFAHDRLPARRGAKMEYDGVIARATRKLANRSKRCGLPVVNVWAGSPVADRLPSVVPDLKSIGSMAAEHLLERGHNRFAFLQTIRGASGDAMAEGFATPIRDAGRRYTVLRVPPEHTDLLAEWRKAERAIGSWMDTWRLPVGVLVATEFAARLLAQACDRRGWRIPDQVAIVSGQYHPMLSEVPPPSLTGVEVGNERIGYEAAQLLDGLIDGGKPPTKPIRIPPKHLVIRESTDFFTVEDPQVAEALRFIASKCHTPIGQDDVADAVGAEVRTLQRRFRKHLDRPIAAEIRRARLERAKRELVNSDRPIADIAEAVGFGSGAQMYQVFRRELGLTPSEYRSENE